MRQRPIIVPAIVPRPPKIGAAEHHGGDGVEFDAGAHVGARVETRETKITLATAAAKPERRCRGQAWSSPRKAWKSGWRLLLEPM